MSPEKHTYPDQDPVTSVSELPSPTLTNNVFRSLIRSTADPQRPEDPPQSASPKSEPQPEPAPQPDAAKQPESEPPDPERNPQTPNRAATFADLLSQSSTTAGTSVETDPAPTTPPQETSDTSDEPFPPSTQPPVDTETNPPAQARAQASPEPTPQQSDSLLDDLITNSANAPTSTSLQPGQTPATPEKKTNPLKTFGSHCMHVLVGDRRAWHLGKVIRSIVKLGLKANIQLPTIEELRASRREKKRQQEANSDTASETSQSPYKFASGCLSIIVGRKRATRLAVKLYQLTHAQIAIRLPNISLSPSQDSDQRSPSPPPAPPVSEAESESATPQVQPARSPRSQQSEHDFTPDQIHNQAIIILTHMRQEDLLEANNHRPIEDFYDYQTAMYKMFTENHAPNTWTIPPGENPITNDSRDRYISIITAVARTLGISANNINARSILDTFGRSLEPCLRDIGLATNLQDYQQNYQTNFTKRLEEIKRAKDQYNVSPTTGEITQKKVP